MLVCCAPQPYAAGEAGAGRATLAPRHRSTRIAMNDKNGNLQSRYEFHSLWSDRLGYLIIVGLAVDIVGAIIVGKSGLEIGLGILANVLIIAGVWGELWFARRAKEAGDGITAEAKARQREAELKLEQLRELAGPRSIDHVVFAKELEGKPKPQHVQIWYLPDSTDGWTFSFHLRVALLEAGWPVDPLPVAIPEPDPNNILTRGMPRAMLAGGQPAGVTIVTSSHADLENQQGANAALMNAIGKSLRPAGTLYGSGGSQFMPVPEGTLRIVVATKLDPLFLKEPPK